MKKLIILPFAEQDIRESTNHYAEKEIGLDKTFLKVINQAFQLILENPLSFPIIIKDIRKFVIKDFPFNIFYIAKKDTIYILAVFHMKRDPGKWKKRSNK